MTKSKIADKSWVSGGSFITALCRELQLHRPTRWNDLWSDRGQDTSTEHSHLDPSLTLDKAVTPVCQAEAVKKQQCVISGDNSGGEVSISDCPVGTIHKGWRGTKNNWTASRQQHPHTDPGRNTRPRCGKSPKHYCQNCPPQDIMS